MGSGSLLRLRSVCRHWRGCVDASRLPDG
ncbi:MAG: hypothetical protein IKX48_08580 [Victivallales bacterium]|nr:hypothetical protein [Victivallales bacterium]